MKSKSKILEPKRLGRKRLNLFLLWCKIIFVALLSWLTFGSTKVIQWRTKRIKHKVNGRKANEVAQAFYRAL